MTMGNVFSLPFFIARIDNQNYCPFSTHLFTLANFNELKNVCVPRNDFFVERLELLFFRLCVDSLWITSQK